MEHDRSVCTHSKDKTWVVFSAEKSTESNDENFARRINMQILLRRLKIPYKVLEGTYKGTKEKSFLIDANYDYLMERYWDVYEQECVMVLKNHKHGLYKVYFKYLANYKEEFKGYLHNVSKEYIDKHECDYTYDPTYDRYFVIKRHDDVREE